MSVDTTYSVGYPYKIYITITSTSEVETGDFSLITKYEEFDSSSEKTRE